MLPISQLRAVGGLCTMKPAALEFHTTSLAPAQPWPGPRIASVLHVEIVAIDRDVVPDGARAPAMVRAGVGVSRIAEAVHEDIRADGTRLRDELVPVLEGVAVLHEAKLAVVQHEGITAPAVND